MGTRLDHLQRLTSELVVATHHFTMASITPHRTPTPSVGMAGMSASELRAGMQDFLRSSGALGSLKTQLRSVITSELLRRRAPRQVMTSTDVCRGTGGNSPGVEEESEVDDAWTMRLADALVEQHLRSTERSFSLAIFSSEADVGFKAAGDGALAALLHLGVPSKPGVGDIVEDASGKQQQCKGSLLQSLASRHLESVGLRHDRPPGYSVGTQTDGDPSNGAAEGSSRPTLEVRLAAVDAKYALCFARVGESARAELERRMEVYREELKLQMEQAYQQRLRAFEQERLHEVRREAEEHYKLLLQHKIEERQEVERSSAQRVEAERARLAQAREDVYLQRMELDRRQREIQLLLDERDKATAATEEQLSEARQQIRVLTAQLQKLEELCGTRLIEVEAARDREMRRASDIRRLQAEHVAELQLKDEEVCRLRFRIRSLMTSQSRGGWRPDAAGGAEGLAAVADASPTVEGAQMGVASLATREAVWQSMWRSVDTGPCPGEAGAAVATAALGEPSGWVEKPVDRPLNSHETQDRGVDGGPCKLLPIGGSGSTSTTTAVIAISGAACMPTTEEVALTAVEGPKPAALEGEHTLSNTNAVESRGTDRRSESRLASSRDTNSGRTERAAPSATKSQATASSRGQSGSSRMSEGLGGAAAIGLSSKTPSASSEKSHPASVPPAPPHVPREHIETLENEEGVQRHGIAKEEEQTRESIVWSATSKRNVLMLQQGSAERDEVSFVEPQPTAISDDDDDNDDILYHKAVEVCGEQWAQEIHQRNMSLPSSAPPPEFLAKHDLDINGLQKVLQQIDESFNMSDDNVDRKLRLQHLERQQAALERLYGETFRRQESPTGFRPMGGTSVPLTAEGAAGGDVVLTPRPTDASATPCHAYTGTTGVAQEAGPYPCSSDTLPPGPSPMLSPSQVTSYPHVGEGETARTTVQPTVKGLAGCGISSPQRSSLRSPEPLPTRYEDAAIRHDHDLVESFLGGVEVKEGHPYVVGGGTGSRGSPGMAGQPWSGYRSLRNPQFRGLMAPRATSVTDRIAAPEHFDVAEDEKLLKILLEKSLGRARRNARKVSESRSNSHNEGVSSKPPPPPSPSRKCESTGRGGGNTFQRVSDVNAPQELPKENYVWGKDAEVGNKVVRELTQKTECLARHLVKSLRDRTQLQCRVDRLEGMLDVANTEVGRLRRSLEQKGDGTLAESAWRATINAKERELRICEDEIRRLRILMEQQIARQGGASAKHGSGAALEQAKSDLEYMTHELGVAHMRQREAEAQLERTKRALGAAESHIQMLDKRLARAERATALARLQDIRSGLETSSGDAPGMLALGALEVSNSAATLETLKQREAIEEWPPAAKRELARLSAQVEGLLLKHEESDRHAELRLSNSNKENETLRRQCDELKREIMTYESHIENLRKESIESGLREGQLRQQLLDLREDAVLLSDLLQATIKSAKEMQQAFTADSLRNVQSRVVTERFVSNVLCDLDTFGRFFSALQRMEVIEPQLGQQSKERMPVSEAIMTRRDFVLRAIDDAMSRPLDKFQSDTRPVPAQHMVRTEKTASAQHTDRTEKTASAQHTDRTEKTSSAQHTDRTEKPAPAQHTDRTEKTASAQRTDHSGKTSSAQRTDHSGKTSSAQRTDHSEKAVPTESAGRNEKPVVQPAAQPGALEEASDGGLNVSTWSYVHDKIPVISPLPSPPFSVAQWEGYHSTVLEDAAVPCRDQQPRGKEIPHLPSSSESRDVHGADHLGSVESFSPSLTNTGTEPRIALVPAISWPEPRGDEKGRAHPRQMAKHRVVSTTVHSSESYISGTPSSQFKLSDSNSVAVLHNRMKDVVPHLQQQPSHSQESQGYLTELEEEPTEGASDERSLGPVLTTLAIPNNNAAVPNARALLKKLNSREDNGAVLRGRALLMDATGREKASDDVIVGGRDAGKRGAVGETTDMRGRQSSGAGGASRNTPVHGFHPPHASIIEPEERSGRLSRAAERSTLANAVTPPPATQEGKTLQANWRPASLPTPDPAPLLRPRTSRGGRIEVAAVLAEPHHPGSGGPTVAAETGVRSSGHNAVRSAGTVTKSQGAADKTEDGRRHRVSAGMEFPSLRHPTLASGKQETS